MSGVTGAGLDQTEVLTQAEAILGVNTSYCCEEKSKFTLKGQHQAWDQRDKSKAINRRRGKGSKPEYF